MAFFRFTKLPKHRQYEYTPRYWNQEKEELAERLKNIEERKKGNPDAMKSRISNGFRRGFSGGRSVRGKQAKRSNLILLAIIVLLVFFTYFALTEYLPGLVESMESGGE
ncbi:MAG: hypothetical protein DHS20C18_25710 [Saprospiraceae bacterium]|nr:MAG: hypothetical protein DHS20C18_25710 [Saprospiraceae bacterium]